MIERHQDYQLTVPVVPPGGVQNVTLQLDTDAPFALRLVRSRNIGTSGWRFKDPKGRYQSSQLRTDLVIGFGSGYPSSFNSIASRGVVIYPEMVYPIGGAIICDIGNTTGENITNAKLLFRGSKLFREGSILAPTYPPKFSVLPFIYPVVVQNIPVVGTVRDNQLRIIHDADFALSYAVADPFALGVDGGPVGNAFNLYNELYVMIRDEARKAYSNEPIHINDVFGQTSPPFVNQNDLPVNFFPGLFTPQIYVERDRSLYFDLFRNDDPLDTSVNLPVDVHFRFSGWKVFNR